MLSGRTWVGGGGDSVQPGLRELNLSPGPSRSSVRRIRRQLQCTAMRAGRVFLLQGQWVVNLPLPHGGVESLPLWI